MSGPGEASQSQRGGIPESGLGEGFRSTTQSIGLSAGATYGLATVGSVQAHDLALVSLSDGHVLGHVVGEGHWYRGHPEFRFELFTGQNRTRQLAEIRKHQAHDVTALEIAIKLSAERYVAGKASSYEVLEAQQQLFPSQINLARTQRDQLLAVVTLYKDLGGGWQDELKPNQHP